MRLIDADALKYEPLPKGDRNYRTYNLDDAYDDGYDDAFTDIRNAPTIDAEPVKHGEWIPISSNKKWIDVSKCSVCGKQYLLYPIDYNYCPQCGARMDGK